MKRAWLVVVIASIAVAVPVALSFAFPGDRGLSYPANLTGSEHVGDSVKVYGDVISVSASRVVLAQPGEASPTIIVVLDPGASGPDFSAGDSVVFEGSLTGPAVVGNAVSTVVR